MPCFFQFYSAQSKRPQITLTHAPRSIRRSMHPRPRDSHNSKLVVTATAIDTRDLLCYNTDRLVIWFEFHMVTALVTATITNPVLLCPE